MQLKHYNNVGQRHGCSPVEAATKLHASRPQKDSSPFRAALSQQESVASFATVRVLSCLHPPLFSCCNTVIFCCDLEARNLVVTITVRKSGISKAVLQKVT
jgi:hypothetical protein